MDVTGMGVGIYDRLRELGHVRSLINPVNFAGSQSSQGHWMKRESYPGVRAIDGRKCG